MTDDSNGNEKTRRTFLKEVAAYGSGLALTGDRGEFFQNHRLLAYRRPPHRAAYVVETKLGWSFYTVRDVMTDQASYISTLEKVAALGYKEVEPARWSYGLSPKDFRALLDRLGLSMPKHRIPAAHWKGPTRGHSRDSRSAGPEVYRH